MRMRFTSVLLFFAILADIACSSGPNVIIILADDMGFGDISCYDGWIDTPHLEALAREGLLFTDFHSNGAVCSPTRAALMTGCYPQRVGIPRVIVARTDADEHHNGLRDREITFAEALRRSGYATAIFGKWHLGYYPRYNPTRHGFDQFRGYVSGNIDFFSHIDQVGKRDWWQDTQLKDEAGYVTHLITERALAFLEHHRDKPFCLYLAHEAPHYPYQGPGDQPERTVNGKFPTHGSRPDKKQAYREMVQELDKSVGQVISKLKELDLQRSTLVFFFSDNGATRLGSNGPLRGFKGSTWEGGHRVPAIAWWPGKIRPGTTGETVLSMDLMPTILAITDTKIPVEHKLDGIDVSQLLFHQRSLPKRTLFWDTERSRAARSGKWKIVQASTKSPDVVRLFDLDTDLGEQRDLAARHPARLLRLRRELQRWLAELGARSSTPIASGETRFASYCAACHQHGGQGTEGRVPPLTGSPWVSGSEGRLIRIVLHGLRGPIEIGGQTYNLEMPAFGPLFTDEEIASMLSYVRRQYGAPSLPITPATVKKVRAETRDRSGYWTVAELLQIPRQG